MWRIGTVSSRLDIQFLGFGQHLVAKVFTELARSLQIGAPAQDVGELFLNRKVGEARGVPLVELDEHIYGAVRGEVVAKYRAEKGQATNMMAPAEVDDAIVRDCDAHPPRGHATGTFCPSRSASLGGTRDGGDLVGEVHLAVVLGPVAELAPGAGQAPEPVGVAADAVDDEERNTVVVRDVLGLHHPDGLLRLIARREIRAEGPMHRRDIARLDVIDVVVARAADAPLHDFQPAAVHLAGGEHEAEQLVGRLRPAVPVVRARRHLGRDHVDAPVPHEPLVVIRRVVGAADDDATHALLQRHAVDIVGERDVGVLGLELGVAVVLPGVRRHARRAHEAAVDDGVGAAEVLAVGVAIGLRQIGEDEAGHGLAVARLVLDIDGHHVPALVERLEHPLGDVAGRPGQHHATLGHHIPSNDRQGHSPRKTGLRFSSIARRPSLASWLRRAAWMRASRSSCATWSRAASARARSALMPASESGALSARVRASAAVAFSTSAAATTSCTMPMASARRASISRPVKSRWRVFAGPMISSSFWARAKPGTRPMRASGMPSRAPSAAILRSQCSASSQPPATASPWITAMVGWREASTLRSTGTMSTCGSRASISRRSRPEQKADPAPRTTTTRTSRRVSRSSKTAASARSSAAFMALRVSGRLRVTVATSSATASRSSADMARWYIIRALARESA